MGPSKDAMSTAEGDEELLALLIRAIDQLVKQRGKQERANITDTISMPHVAAGYQCEAGTAFGCYTRVELVAGRY